MPDFYAHQVFGGLVWDALPQPVQARLTPERPGWDCGLYGPDPLFFHSLRWGDPVSREGHGLHRAPPGEFLTRLAAAGDVSYVVGYAAGSLTHYLLDSACHPIVGEYAGGSARRHTLLEGAFDRSLIPAGQSGPPRKIPADAAVYIAAAAGYQRTGPEEYARSLRRFLLVSRLTAGFRRLTPSRQARRDMAERLKRCMYAQTAPAAGLVARLVEAMDAGKPLDFLPTLNFSGREAAGGPVC